MVAASMGAISALFSDQLAQERNQHDEHDTDRPIPTTTPRKNLIMV
jgi:hypothetical protein